MTAREEYEKEAATHGDEWRSIHLHLADAALAEADTQLMFRTEQRDDLLKRLAHAELQAEVATSNERLDAAESSALHWKLTAKQAEEQVRELEESISRAFRLLRDAHYGEDPMALVELDDLLESLTTAQEPKEKK